MVVMIVFHFWSCSRWPLIRRLDIGFENPISNFDLKPAFVYEICTKF